MSSSPQPFQPSAMPATYSSRTYGKRNSMKRRLTSDRVTSSDEDSEGRKRLKTSVDNDLPHSTVITPTTPTLEEILEGGSNDLEKPVVKVTYGTPRKNSAKQRSITPELISQPTVVTPKKQARDLSQIFAFTTPPASSKAASKKSSTKLSKRMLTRSKTEPVIDSQLTSHALDRTSSLPSLEKEPSSSQPLSTNEPAGDSGSTSAIPVPAPAPSKNTTRTYAGSSRSFLVAMPASSLSYPTTTSVHESQSQSMIDEEDDFLTRESYSSLRERWGVDNSEDDPYPLSASPSPKGKGKERQRPPPVPLPNGMMNPLKSITELRSKGESRRFLDEVGYLFEGMARRGAIGLRRASAQEITTKLCDPNFARKARAADFFGKAWDVFIEAGAGGGEDKLLDILLAFLAALIARHPSSLAELAQRETSSPPPETLSPEKPRKGRNEEMSDESSPQFQSQSFVGTLFAMLDSFCISDPLLLVALGTDVGDAELRKAGIGKKEKAILSTIYGLIAKKSNIFEEYTPVSTPLLIVYALQSLPPSLLHRSHLASLLASLQAATFSSSSMKDGSASLASSLYIAWKDLSSQISYENIHFHLRLLDTYLLKQWGDERSLTESQGQGLDGKRDSMELDDETQSEDELDKAREEWLVEELVALGVYAELRLQEADEDADGELGSAGKCLEFALRVLVSLTYSDARWGKKVLENEYAIGWVMRIITSAAGINGRDATKKEEYDVKMKNEDGSDSGGDLKTDDERGGEYVRALDRLCLGLGLLTNLVQVVSGSADTLRETRMDPTCILRKRACVRSCTCSNTTSLIDILGQLYRQQLSSDTSNPLVKAEPDDKEVVSSQLSEELNPSEVDVAYLRGHLSILFGLLMRSSKMNQAAVLSALPVPSDDVRLRSRPSREAGDRAKLDMLVDQARDFVGLYAVLSANNQTEDSKDSKVAIEVVKFLEDLRSKL